MSQVADKFTPEEKRAVVAHLLTMSAQRVKQATVQRAPAVVTDEQLVLGIKHVVVPMLTRAFEKGEGPAILDAASLKVIISGVPASPLQFHERSHTVCSHTASLLRPLCSHIPLMRLPPRPTVNCCRPFRPPGGGCLRLHRCAEHRGAAAGHSANEAHGGAADAAPQGAYQVWLEPAQARGLGLQAVCICKRLSVSGDVSGARQDHPAG